MAASGRLLANRVAVVVAVGSIAAAGSDDGPPVGAGGALWAPALAAPLAAPV